MWERKPEARSAEDWRVQRRSCDRVAMARPSNPDLDSLLEPGNACVPRRQKAVGCRTGPRKARTFPRTAWAAQRLAEERSAEQQADKTPCDRRMLEPALLPTPVQMASRFAFRIRH